MTGDKEMEHLEPKNTEEELEKSQESNIEQTQELSATDHANKQLLKFFAEKENHGQIDTSFYEDDDDDKATDWDDDDYKIESSIDKSMDVEQIQEKMAKMPSVSK
eukprot:gb/GECH01003146.1/.p1 GENE.gb/GECH01003146.1/~~gb/GECH01003146.1/.p1  ORF type:complete len:105 (+),score=44.50 gb/GECH01003146.1/:1-315(+)